MKKQFIKSYEELLDEQIKINKTINSVEKLIIKLKDIYAIADEKQKVVLREKLKQLEMICEDMLELVIENKEKIDSLSQNESNK